MTEYWKSNTRKFCEYCKCWFADNKASINFHEAGKNHKENVQKKLSEIAKKGREDEHNRLMTDDYMKAMEDAAMTAYKKDLEANPDITGAKVNKLAKDQNVDIVLSKTVEKVPTEWCEAKSSDGSSYYYHKITKVTKWERPAEGFLTLEEQKKLKKSKKKEEKKKRKEDPARNSSNSSKNEILPNSHNTSTENRDSQADFGSWTTVEKPVMPELQLPGGDYEEEEECWGPVQEKKVHKFEVKTMQLTQGSTMEDTGFKKRKNADSFKKNSRKRTEDL